MEKRDGETPGRSAAPPTDDRARNDGGALTDDERVPPENLEKTRQAARDHTKDEPGS